MVQYNNLLFSRIVGSYVEESVLIISLMAEHLPDQ